MQRHDDLIKAHAVRWAIIIRQRAAVQLILEVTDKTAYMTEGRETYPKIAIKIRVYSW